MAMEPVPGPAKPDPWNCYCYLPLYIFCGAHLLAARLRRANIDGSAGAKGEVARIVAQIHQGWPEVKIQLRADPGFARKELKGAKPRFVVTSFKAEIVKARELYERLYCARGDMENRIKGEERPWRQWRRVSVTNQLDLFADRASAATMRANQLRLWFASLAYVLLSALRRKALAHTQLAKATCGTIRAKLLKIGALVRISVRRIRIAMAATRPRSSIAAPVWSFSAPATPLRI